MAPNSADVTPEGRLEMGGSLVRDARDAGPGSVTLMLHGFKYDPRDPGHDPHNLLYPAWRDGLGGACIGVGWPARGSFWQAWRAVERSAPAVASLVTQLATGGRQVHLVGHSLGARLALRALDLSPPGTIDRVLLLNGAAKRREARRALSSPAGEGASVLNVITSGNGVFDLICEAATGLSDRTLGRGLPDAPARWLDLRLDDPDTRARLGQAGYRIAGPSARVDHWSGYLREGVFDLYRDVLGPRRLPLSALRALDGAALDNIMDQSPARTWGRSSAGLSPRT